MWNLVHSLPAGRVTLISKQFQKDFPRANLKLGICKNIPYFLDFFDQKIYR